VLLKNHLTLLVLADRSPAVRSVEPLGARTLIRTQGCDGIVGFPKGFACKRDERLADASAFMCRGDKQRPNPAVSPVAGSKPWIIPSSAHTQISDRSMKSEQSAAVTRFRSDSRFSRTECLMSMIREMSDCTARRMVAIISHAQVSDQSAITVLGITPFANTWFIASRLFGSERRRLHDGTLGLRHRLWPPAVLPFGE
jgi:hypothetical protein